MHRFIAAVAVFALAVAPAHAAELNFTTTMSGVQEPTMTGSAATGTATLSVDTETQTIDARVVITGLSFADLAQHLAHSRMGPMHLHRYQAEDVTLIVPFPLNTTYAETADGFTVTMTDFPYAEAAERTGSDLSFEDFLAALAADPIYLNIHTEHFPQGEISGRVATAR